MQCNFADVERSAINLIRSLSAVQHTHKPLQHRMKNSPLLRSNNKYIEELQRVSLSLLLLLLLLQHRYIRTRSCDALLSRTFASTTSTTNCKHLTSWLQVRVSNAHILMAENFDFLARDKEAKRVKRRQYT
uniref:Uncharacterized protein n=1 Tax=Trichogramma kaykai TaxID=54128 RepID=A0ABD2WSV5_9HYME